MNLVEWFVAKSKKPPSFKKGVNEKGRVIFKPNRSIRLAGGRLLGYLNKNYSPRFFYHATGGVKGKSVMNHILPHKKKRFLWVTDIKNCFPSIQLDRLCDVICRQIYDLEEEREDFLNFLQCYCSTDGQSLAIGFPASTLLANIYLNELVDIPLIKLIHQRGYGLRFTHYLDDYVFSSPLHPIGRAKTKALREVFEKAGFKLNDRKTRYVDLRKEKCIEITGVAVHYGGKTGLPGKERRKIKGLIHLAQQGRISPYVIHGHMTWFYYITGGYYTNQERNLQNLYRIFLGQVKLTER